MLKRIAPDQVALDMYIRKFEGSWFYHPFWRARFIVRTEQQLARIRNSGVHVFIDPGKGADVAAPAIAPASPPKGHRALIVEPRSSPSPAPAWPVVPKAPARIVAPQSFGKADKARATALAQRSTKVVKALFENCQIGRAVSTAPILSVVDDIATTLEQNSAAFISVTRLRSKDDAVYTHSIAVCALMIGLAREAGCPRETIRAMGTAGLFHDVGKVVIDQALLLKTDELVEAEIADLRRHPQAGYEILSAETGLPPAAMDVCLNHHERLDGSGYPFGLKEKDISQAVRMATICDIYDAMTSGGSYKKGISPTDAITQMEAMDGKLDGSLLFKFMRSIGVFPAGKLIRLRSNRLAIVLPATGTDRQPLARAFYATVDTCFTDYQDVVLSDRLNDDQAVSDEDPARWFRGDWFAMRVTIEAGRPLPAAHETARALS